MFFDSVLRVLTFQGAQQPANVRWVGCLNFFQITPAVATKREHQVVTVLSHFPHRIERFEVVEASAKFRCIARTVAVNDPPFQFAQRAAKRRGVFHGKAPKQQHRCGSIGRCGVGSLKPNPVAFAQCTKVVGPWKAQPPDKFQGVHDGFGLGRKAPHAKKFRFQHGEVKISHVVADKNRTFDQFSDFIRHRR